MRWVLYLTNGRQVLYQVNRSGALPLWQGEGAPPGRRPEVWRIRRVSVIVDLMEEEFRFEHLPHLTGSDRRALWSRKQRQLYRDEPHVSVTSLGREKSGRRDDLLLFTAIRDTGSLREWMEILACWRITVKAIWSLPRLSAGWRVRPLDAGMRLLMYRCGGKIALRQNFHRNGSLVFSRLSLVAEESAEAEGGQELERTWRYLGRLLELDPGKAVDLQVWTAAARMRMAQGLTDELPYFRSHCLRLDDVAADFGWKGDPGHLDIPAMAAWLSARRRFILPSHYRDPILSRLEKRRWVRGGLYAGSVGLLAVASGYDGQTEHRMVQLNEEMQLLQQQRQALSLQLGTLHAPAPVAGLEPWQLEALVELKRKVEAGRIRPGPVLEIVSSALGGFPPLELTGLEWRRLTAQDEDEDTEASGIDLSRPLLVIATIKVHVGSDGIRSTVGRVERFTRLLAKRPDVNGARLAGSSLPIGEDETVSGEMGSLEDVTDSAIFTIEFEYGSGDAPE